MNLLLGVVTNLVWPEDRRTGLQESFFHGQPGGH